MDTTEFATALFEDFCRAGVRICHWKSNSHLDAALGGRTDLDVLVHPDDSKLLNGIFVQYGICQVRTPWEGRYSGLEDWIGLDHASGGFIHLHVHYRLVLGPQHAKCFHLPIEEWIFANLQRRDGIPIPAPAAEMLLLILRMHLKLRPSKMRKKRHGPGREVFPDAINLEFELLARQVTEEALRRAIASSALEVEEERIVEFFHEFSRDNITYQQICRLRRAAFRSLEPHRWESRLRAFTRLIVKRILKEKMIRRALHPRKKRLVSPGRVVALIGADGAGKSTLVDTLREKFSWKLCVTVAYLGIPKRALVVRVLKKGQRRLRSWGLHKLSRVADDLRWLWIAHYRLRTARRAHRLAERGMIVFLDRYPQPEFSTMPEPMDGPRIQKLRGGRETIFGAHEQRLYKKIPPATDTFVLKAPLDCLRSRKDDLTADKHRLKVDAVNALRSKPGRFDVDVTQPLENVSLDITRELWSRLSPSTAHSSSGRQHLSAHQPVR